MSDKKRRQQQKSPSNFRPNLTTWSTVTFSLHYVRGELSGHLLPYFYVQDFLIRTSIVQPEKTKNRRIKDVTKSINSSRSMALFDIFVA